MLNICLVLIVVIGLLFIYFVFFAKKDVKKEKMEGQNSQTMEIINYNTDWCGYSKRFEPIWLEFEKEMSSKYPDVKVTNMKCDNPDNKSKCNIPEVEGFPTVVLHKGNSRIVFNDSRTKENLLKFIDQSK